MCRSEMNRQDNNYIVSVNACIDLINKDVAFDEGVRELLRIAGEYYGGSRAFAILVDDGELVQKLTYEWCRECTGSQLPFLEELDATGAHTLADTIGEHDTVLLEVQDAGDPYVELLHKWGVERSLITRVYSRDTFCGYLVIDNPVEEEPGFLIQIAGFIRNIKQRHDWQLSIRANDSREELLYDMIESGSWTIELDENMKPIDMEWNNDVRKMIGWDESEYPSSLDSWQSLIHPEEVAVPVAMLDAFIQSRGQSTYDASYRIKTKHEGWRWYRTTARMMPPDEDGHILCVGLFIDVNSEKEKEFIQQEKEKALDDLQNMENVLDTLYEAIGSAKWQSFFDEEGNSQGVIFGDSFRELLGYDSEEEFPNDAEALHDHMYPEDRERAFGDIEAFDRDPNPFASLDTTYRMVRKDGELIWIHGIGRKYFRPDGTPVGAVGVLYDISDEVRSKEQAHLIDALSNEYESVYSFDTSDNIVHVVRNTKIEGHEQTVSDAIVGKQYEDVMALIAEQFIKIEDREKVLTGTTIEHLREHVKEDEIYSISFSSIDEQQRDRFFQICFARTTKEDGNDLFAFGFRDIDEIMREEMLKREELKEAKQRAEDANVAKSAFLFSMSHDIRTPMNAVLGLSKLASDHIEDTDKLRDYLEEIGQAGDQLLNIINRVLEVSRIESMKLEFLEENTDSLEVYKSIVAVFDQQAKEHDLKLSFVNNLKYRWMYMDRTHMEAVIANVLGNAIKYTPSGGEIEVSFTSLPGIDDEHTVCQTVIRDNGIGMSEEFQTRLFQQFEREEDSTTSGIQGLGLGLAIVKRLVDLMNGTIRVESEKRVGTTVTIEIPHKVGFEPVETQEVQTDEIVLEGKHVLMAEDIDVNAMIAQEIRSSHGLIVDRVKNGRECVERLNAVEADHYDLILMDIQMPEMNGYQAAEIIRNQKDERKASIPIIALTANAFMEDRLRALSAGMNSHVGKPIDIPQLIDTIGRVLSHKEYYVDNRELNEFRDSYFRKGCVCGYFVYRDDEEERIVGADDTTASIFGCKDSEEFLHYVGSTFRGMVHPEDLETVEAEINAQQAANKNDIDLISYRIIRKDGKVRRVADIGYKAFDGEDKLYYVYITDVTDLTDE